MSELRPCPFCGAGKLMQGLKLGGPHVIWCHECSAEITGTPMDAAISAWNRRADDWQPIETAPKDGTEDVMPLCRGMVRAGFVRAAMIADNYPAHSHGSLATDPREAAAQAAREIAAAIRALGKKP